QVAAERRPLPADDDLERQTPVARDRPAGQSGIDALMVGDGDDVEVTVRGDVLDDRHDVGDPVRGDRMDVQVGATAFVRLAAGHAASSAGSPGGAPPCGELPSGELPS